MTCVELIVSGIPPSYPRDYLLMEFERCGGRVAHIKCIKGMSVLVHIKDSEAADRALAELNGATLAGGQTITVARTDRDQALRRSRTAIDRTRCRAH